MTQQLQNAAKRVHFLMIGGFLGAGKTTAIARLARHYVDEGRHVGLVTNDQAYDLVDTHTLRAEGFSVGEVPGACFCCKFDDLVQTISQLAEAEQPDVIVAEPVGSCTDLVATVVEPMRHLYGDRFEAGPLAVLLKPEHGRRILAGGTGRGFSPKAAYIFTKQIEEADIVAINKIDKLADDELAELVDLVHRRFPDKRVLAISARGGNRFDELIQAISDVPGGRSIPEVDYDIYAEGEAELGWLNCTLHVARQADSASVGSGAAFDLDQLLLEFVRRVAVALARSDAEPAHLKVLAQADGTSAVANLVSSSSEVELSRASGAAASQATLMVNARVAADPELLRRVVIDEITAVAAAHGCRQEIERMQNFRPARPVPTHRMS